MILTGERGLALDWLVDYRVLRLSFLIDFKLDLIHNNASVLFQTQNESTLNIFNTIQQHKLDLTCLIIQFRHSKQELYFVFPFYIHADHFIPCYLDQVVRLQTTNYLHGTTCITIRFATYVVS